MLSPDEWRTDALCRGATDAFYDEEHPEHARESCDRCPVRTQCLADALRYEKGADATRRYGVWAGLTPAQRVSAERRGAVVCPVCGAGLDPTLVRAGVVRCPSDVRHTDRIMSVIPDEGDDWSKRHLVLARRVLRSLEDGTRPSRPRSLAALWKVKEADMRRVYEALVNDGTLASDGHGNYSRTHAAAKIDAATWEPAHEVIERPKRGCRYADCQRPHVAKDLCGTHYKAEYRAGTLG